MILILQTYRAILEQLYTESRQNNSVFARAYNVMHLLRSVFSVCQETE